MNNSENSLFGGSRKTWRNVTNAIIEVGGLESRVEIVVSNARGLSTASFFAAHAAIYRLVRGASATVSKHTFYGGRSDMGIHRHPYDDCVGRRRMGTVIRSLKGFLCEKVTVTNCLRVVE